MKGSVKRTASRDETEMVEVQGSTEAECSSHQTRKRCRKAKIVEGSSDQPQEGGGKAKVIDGSSDQPQEGGGKAKVIDGSSDQTKKRGPKAKLPPDELKARRAMRDSIRYKNMMDSVKQVPILKKKNAELERELETQKNETKELEILKNKFAEFERELKTQKNETKELRVDLGKLNSELVPAITENLKPVTEQLEIVKNDYKKVESLFEGFVQSEENGCKIPWDYDFLNGKALQKNMLMDLDLAQENSSMVLASPEHISNGKNLMTDSEYPADYFDLLGGMPKEETLAMFKKAVERDEELMKLIEGINSRLTDIETTIRAMKPKK